MDTTSRLLPTFLVIGAMKAGTTSLSRYLLSHPEIYMATPKELRFFSHDENWARGLDWYANYFRDATDTPARGEASTDYTKAHLYPEAAARIAATLPDARLVYVVRDPVERIRSHYDHEVVTDAETRPIEQVVVEDPVYVDTSSYGRQLEQYLEHFDRAQILVVDADDLKHRRAETVKRIYDFLGVDPDFTTDELDREYYVTSSRSSLRPSVRAAKGNPLVKAIARHTPKGLKKKLLRTSIAQRQPDETREPATVTPELRAELLERLDDDLVLFEKLAGPIGSAWR